MSTLKKIGWVLGGLFALSVAVMVGIAFLYGNGAITVVAPEEEAVRVTVDGKVVGTVAAGTHSRFNVEQGKHDVALSAAHAKASYTLDVKNGGFDQLIPLPAQCFVLTDVTEWAFEKVNITQKLRGSTAKIEEKFEGAPFDLPSGAYFSMEELPKEIREHQKTEVLFETPCELVKRPDTEIVAALGLD